jgi:hypothetical protein
LNRRWQYLTLLDNYLLMCFGVLFIVAIETPLVHLAVNGYSFGVSYEGSGVLRDGVSVGAAPPAREGAWCVDSRGRSCELDLSCCIGLGASWLLANLYFVYRAWSSRRHYAALMSTERLVEMQRDTEAKGKQVAQAEAAREKAHKAVKSICSGAASGKWSRNRLGGVAKASAAMRLRPAAAPAQGRGAEAKPSQTEGNPGRALGLRTMFAEAASACPPTQLASGGSTSPMQA